MAKRILIQLYKNRHVQRVLKVGDYEITLKLVDAPSKPVEVHKDGEPLVAGFIDPYGFFSFEDTIEGLNPIKYAIYVGNEFYGRITIYPKVIDANEILDDAISLTKTVLTNVMLGGIRYGSSGG